MRKKVGSSKKGDNKKRSKKKFMGKFPAIPGNPDPKSHKWIELYALTEHWQSDIRFFKDELRFLHRVTRKYLLWLTDDGNIRKTRSMVNYISEAEAIRNSLALEIDKHMLHIKELIQNPFPYDDSQIQDEHMKLENGFTVFVKNFRSLKEEVFELTERVMDTETEANQYLVS
jgi:hypothetical protein